MSEPIDFVITWVDGNDEEWLKEKNQYMPKEKNGGSPNRYKDWGLFPYLFRGIEKFAPWVNKVYLITWGHLPKWINTNNPKLVIINHKDYIPEKYLPTFNSNVIELNVHRIQDLSENFVLFNDDTFIIKDVSPKDFFVNDKPCDTLALNVHCPKKSMIIQSICNNNVGIINEHFDYSSTFKKNWKLWFHPKNGRNMLRTFALCSCPRYPGFWQSHLPLSHKKSIFKKMWEIEPEIMDLTSSHKFRESTEVNHWLMKEWYIASGEVVNRSANIGQAFYVGRDDIDKIGGSIISTISKQKKKMVCVNDGDLTDERFEAFVPKMIEAFDKILPEKSSFEK